MLDSTFQCEPLPEGYCPSEPPDGSCVVEIPGMACEYPDAVSCICNARFAAPGTAGEWSCYGPPIDPACPATLPNIGEGCASNGVQCNYALDGCTAPPNSTVYCFDGSWEEGERLSCLL